ncbi:integrin alpha-L-like, partial [Clarias magur]
RCITDITSPVLFRLNFSQSDHQPSSSNSILNIDSRPTAHVEEQPIAVGGPGVVYHPCDFTEQRRRLVQHQRGAALPSWIITLTVQDHQGPVQVEEFSCSSSSSCLVLKSYYGMSCRTGQLSRVSVFTYLSFFLDPGSVVILVCPLYSLINITRHGQRESQVLRGSAGVFREELYIYPTPQPVMATTVCQQPPTPQRQGTQLHTLH